MSKCRHCGSPSIVRLSSIDKKICADCKQYTEWKLKANQQSVLIKKKKG